MADETEKMVSVFVDANQRSILTEIIRATSVYQATLFLEELSQIIVGFRDGELVCSFERYKIGMGRMMAWAGRPDHLAGIPRATVLTVVGALAKVVANLLNSTAVHNADTLLRLVRSRPPGVPLITVSNHISTLDDPVMWGFKGFPISDANLGRWVLAAEDICFKNVVLSYFFRLGKCIPITRGAGIHQEHMDEALECLSNGEWIHTFPEGKVYQEDSPIRRLKWGTASLIVRSPITPIILPIFHHGLQEVMPENYWFGRRPLLPLCNKKIEIFIGDPIEFDLPRLRQSAISMAAANSALPPPPAGAGGSNSVDEAARRYMYSDISSQIQGVLEKLRCFSKSFQKLKP